MGEEREIYAGDYAAAKNALRCRENCETPIVKEMLVEKYHIRWLIRRDMEEVLAIERQSFEFPWTENDFIRCLRHKSCIGMVAEQDERVVGFMVYELHKSSLHLLSLAVGADFRRRDVARQLVEKLKRKLSGQRRAQIFAGVRETNLPAQLLFKQLGFRAIEVLRAWYEENDEDCYRMEYRLEAARGVGVMR